MTMGLSFNIMLSSVATEITFISFASEILYTIGSYSQTTNSINPFMSTCQIQICARGVVFKVA